LKNLFSGIWAKNLPHKNFAFDHPGSKTGFSISSPFFIDQAVINAPTINTNTIIRRFNSRARAPACCKAFLIFLKSPGLRGVYGLFPANSVGDDVELYTDKSAARS